MAVVPAKRARLNRARASRDPVIHGRRERTNRFDYWIPALARRAMPGSVGRNDRQGRELRDNGITLKRANRCAAGRTCPVFDRLLAFKPTDYADRLITTGGDATCAATRDDPATRQKQASRSYPRSRL
jgi:hypothetical protein